MRSLNVLKSIFSIILVCVLMTCLSVGAYGFDIVSETQNPHIEIDGRDIEPIWVESSRIIFDISPDIGSWLSVEMLNYQNSIYGMVAFTDISESVHDLVVRIDLHYEKYSGYVIFVMQKELIIWESDSLIFDGVIKCIDSDYRAEFSISAKQASAFSQGDLVQVEIKYGCVGEIDDYTKMPGFYEMKILDCYIGGQYIEELDPETPKTTKPTTTKTTKPKTTKTTKKKTTKTTKKKTTKAKTTKSTTTTTTTTQAVNNSNINQGAENEDGFLSTGDLKFIVTLCIIAMVITVIFSLVMRKSGDRKKYNYTDEDKGCD